MTDQDGGAVLRRQRPAGDGDVVRQGRGRVLDDADLVPVLGQDVVDLFPARAVHEAAVDEDDVLDRAGRRSLDRARAGQNPQSGG